MCGRGMGCNSVMCCVSCCILELKQCSSMAMPHRSCALRQVCKYVRTLPAGLRSALVNAPQHGNDSTAARNITARAAPYLGRIRDATVQLSSPFHCSGSVAASKPALCCPASDGNSLVINMPASEEQLHALMGLCSVATFGKGAEAVNDPSYRKALALATDKFFTNFDLSAHDILTTIKTAMMPDAASVTAQLYKLNIYRPGDFFKSHVDTPRGDGMFGSLVVCLPQPHTGGALLVRHKGQEQHFDFAAASANTVQWAAFYSDCEHEILPVETGHRVTLTYNLYCNKNAQAEGPCLPGLDVDGLDLSKTLAEAVADQHFMSKGGDLAFGCEHAYPHTTDGLCLKLPTMLKGRDALCYKVLQQLGLKPAVKSATDWGDMRACHDDDWDGDDNKDEDKGNEAGKGEVLEGEEGEEADVSEDVQLSAPAAVDWAPGCIGYDYDISEVWGEKERIMWVRESNVKQLQWYALSYGNEPDIENFYSGAAVVAFIPAWGSPDRQQLVASLAQGRRNMVTIPECIHSDVSWGWGSCSSNQPQGAHCYRMQGH